jgi:hypothetical protein
VRRIFQRFLAAVENDLPQVEFLGRGESLEDDLEEED